jgi:two-component system, chemotaxis family, protein-glutamate methylesterase/glutaminase
MSATRHSSWVSPFAAVVVVGSQGALRAFMTMAAGLPPEFPVGIVFDLHRVERGATEGLLSRRSALPVVSAGGGRPVERGTIHLAPAHSQLLFDEDRCMQILPGGDGVGHRFADPLLESASVAFGENLIAVVLSGRLSGGAEGVRAVKQRGGRVLAQDPRTAEAASMPDAALATGCVDFAFEPQLIACALTAFCGAEGAAELFRVRLNAGVHR